MTCWHILNLLELVDYRTNDTGILPILIFYRLSKKYFRISLEFLRLPVIEKLNLIFFIFIGHVYRSLVYSLKKLGTYFCISYLNPNYSFSNVYYFQKDVPGIIISFNNFLCLCR